MKKEQFFNFALTYLGIPYIWGGKSRISGFDCSGLVIDVYQSIGLMPRGSDMDAQGLYERFIDDGYETYPEIGAMCFFGKDRNNITHVGLMLDSEYMIHAAAGGPHIRVASDGAYARVDPHRYRRDFLCCVTPKRLNLN